MASAALEEQQEKLRRFVDAWRSQSHHLLNSLFRDNDLHGSFSASDIGSSSSDPVHVHVEPLEHSDVSTLIQSDNVGIAKFLTVLSYDCFEIRRLCRYVSKNIYRQLLLFGYRSSKQEMLLEGKPQKAFGHSLSLFMELSDITCRMSAVLGNLLQQMDSIYSSRDVNSRAFNSLQNVTFKSAFASFGDGLAMFLVFDEILMQNSKVKSYLSLYMRMLNNVKMGADTFGISVGDLDSLDQVVSHLEKVLDVGSFLGLLEESFWQDMLQKVRCNKKFLNACSNCIHAGFSAILPRLATWKGLPFHHRKILSYMALVLFLAYASAEAPEKRLGKLIVEILQVVPIIYVEGDIRFVLSNLLKTHFPQSLSSWPTLREVARECDAMKINYLTRLTEIQSRDWQAMKDALASWVASFQSNVYPLAELSTVEACLRLHMKQIIQGILLANRMQIVVISMLDLHSLLEVPIRREKLKSLCHMVVSLKVVEHTFHKKGLDIIRSLPHIINLLQADIEQLILPLKDELYSEVSKGNQMSKMSFLSSLIRGKDIDSKLRDSLSMVLLSLQMLKGGGSNKRQLILSIIMDVVQGIGHLDIDYLRIEKLISKAEIIADFQSIIERVTDCGFLYWRKEMIGMSLSMIYMDVNKISWLQYLLDGFCDGLQLLKLGNVGNFTLKLYEEEIENAVKNEIITPLCRDIETDLRLHVHSTHLKGSVNVNPTKTGVRNLSWYLQMRPLQLPSKRIDIKLNVESYLNSAFYNHTVMSSYNWKIYSEMIQLAKLKYGLALDDIHLPEKSLDHAIDVYELMQNLPKFAATYSYNIHNQVFIEKASSSEGRKSLSVFGVEHVASSLATHGRGLIATAMSLVLKFLTQKFQELSELLQDNFVISHLMKESDLSKCDKEAISKHPVVQVEELTLAMGKLSVGDCESTLLQKLLCVIAEMGNGLGLVRSLCAGCSRHACSISRFIYRPRGVTSYAETCHKLGYIDEIVTAGRVMDMAANYKYEYEEHTDFVSSLICAFSKEFQRNENVSLKDFFLIVPALIINLVDCNIRQKEILLKVRDAENQIPINDGFMMGVAFILKVTGQEKSFDGLNWFANASKHFREAMQFLEESKVTDQQQSSGFAGLKLWSQVAPPLSAETQKAIDRLDRYKKQVEYIQCTVNVARTILQWDTGE